MPKLRKNDLVRCRHFCWRLTRRAGVWQADGRSNTTNAGRHSLGTADRAEALQLVHQLDATVAANLGKTPRETVPTAVANSLHLNAGRTLYEEHLKRPRVSGGVRESTQKRYRAVFDKFIQFATKSGVETWNAVTRQTLDAYAAGLDRKGYAGKTLRHELTVLIQAHKWLLQEKHLTGIEPIHLAMKKVEGERAYCYTDNQVRAMIEHCRSKPNLSWLKQVIVALACTGLRISELAGLRWGDIDLANGRLLLTDESGRACTDGRARRQLKSGRSRHLPLHPDLVAALSELQRNDGVVFRGPRGARLKPDTVRQILVRDVIKPLESLFPSFADEQGFKDGRLHGFRHYFASMCAINGVSERVAMDWLGHHDSAMVRHYFHLNDAESRRQMLRLNPLGTLGKRLAAEEAATKELGGSLPGESQDTVVVDA